MVAVTALILHMRNVSLAEVEWLPRGETESFLLPRSLQWFLIGWSSNFLTWMTKPLLSAVLICTVLSLHVWPRLPSLQVFDLLTFVTSFVFSCEQYSLFPTPPFSDYLLRSSGFSVSTTSSREVHQGHHAHCIVRSFSKGLLRIPFVPGTVLGTRNVTVTKEEQTSAFYSWHSSILIYFSVPHAMLTSVRIECVWVVLLHSQDPTQ